MSAIICVREALQRKHGHPAVLCTSQEWLDRISDPLADKTVYIFHLCIQGFAWSLDLTTAAEG